MNTLRAMAFWCSLSLMAALGCGVVVREVLGMLGDVWPWAARVYLLMDVADVALVVLLAGLAAGLAWAAVVSGRRVMEGWGGWGGGA